MAPSAASSAEHHRRSTFGVVDAAPMVVAVTTTAPSVAPSKSTTNQQNQHHHHPNRAGAPLSALSMLPSGMGTPPMDVVGHRRTFSTSSAHGILPQVWLLVLDCLVTSICDLGLWVVGRGRVMSVVQGLTVT